MNHSSKKHGRILAPIREDELYSLQTLHDTFQGVMA
jgi:hypothetical protein